MDEWFAKTYADSRKTEHMKVLGMHGESPGPIREDPQHGAPEESRRSAGSHPAQEQVHAEEASDASSPDPGGSGRGRDRSSRPMGCDGCFINQPCGLHRDDRCSASSCTGGSVGRDLRTSPTGELKQALQILNAASSRRH